MKLIDYLVEGLEKGDIKPNDLSGLYLDVRTAVLERYCKRLTARKLREADTAV